MFDRPKDTSTHDLICAALWLLFWLGLGALALLRIGIRG